MILASCTTYEASWPATDYLGYVYPPECRRDLSDVTTPTGRAPLIIPVPPASLEIIARKRHLNASRRLFAITYAQTIILIDETLSGWFYQDILHHEQCHVLLGPWHKE